MRPLSGRIIATSLIDGFSIPVEGRFRELRDDDRPTGHNPNRSNGRVGGHPENFASDHFTPQCVFHLSSTEDRDRVGSHDHRGWQIGSPVMTSSRNRCIE
jgi:hypothetical protein